MVRSQMLLMHPLQNRSLRNARALLLVFGLSMIGSFAGPSSALPACVAGEETPSLGALAQHDHQPIHVRSKPVIERLPVRVISPIDLALTDDGCVLIADDKANCVFRLDASGSVSLMAENLLDMQRIRIDADNSVYVLTSSAGESSLHQITPGGQHIILQTFNFPATTFVRDTAGQFVISVKQTGRVVSVSPEGAVADVGLLNQVPLDLAYNAGGQLEALLPSGHVVRVPSSGEVTVSGFAQLGSRRLVSLQDGSLLTLCTTDVTRTQVLHVSRTEDRPDQFDVVANVPAGTSSLGFDSLGNLCLANADLRAVTKVTSHFEIPCPHCRQPTRMIFSTDGDPAAASDSRGF